MNSKSWMTQLARGARVVLVAVLIIAAGFSPPSVQAHGVDVTGDGFVDASGCAHHLGETWDKAVLMPSTAGSGALSIYTGDSWWTYATRGTSSDECSNFAYFLVRSLRPRTMLIVPLWPANYPSNHCVGFPPHFVHAFVAYAVFTRPNAGSPWHLAGSGRLVGKDYPETGCVYANDGQPPVMSGTHVIFPGDEGTTVLRLTLHARGDIAIIQQNWAHNNRPSSPSFCGESTCFHPVRVNIFFR